MNIQWSWTKKGAQEDLEKRHKEGLPQIEYCIAKFCQCGCMLFKGRDKLYYCRRCNKINKYGERY